MNSTRKYEDDVFAFPNHFHRSKLISLHLNFNNLLICSDDVFCYQMQMCVHRRSRLEPVPSSCFSVGIKAVSCPLSSPSSFCPLGLFPLPFIFLPMMLLLTGGGCSRQMLKCLVWSGFTRRRATRDSPMNSLCVSLSSSHTDTLGLKERGERWRGGVWRKRQGERGKHELNMLLYDGWRWLLDGNI